MSMNIKWEWLSVCLCVFVLIIVSILGFAFTSSRPCLVLLCIKFGKEDGRKTFQYAKYNLVLCFCLYTCDSLNFIIKSFLIKVQKYTEINWIKIELEIQQNQKGDQYKIQCVPVLNVINISNMILKLHEQYFWSSHCTRHISTGFSNCKSKINFQNKSFKWTFLWTLFDSNNNLQTILSDFHLYSLKPFSTTSILVNAISIQHTHKSNDNLALATKNKVVHFISTRAV